MFCGIVAKHNQDLRTFGGPHAKELFSLPFVLTETLFLLTSSFTVGLAMLARNGKSKSAVTSWMWVTFVLGFSFGDRHSVYNLYEKMDMSHF